jgi:serine/threonine protein kinase
MTDKLTRTIFESEPPTILLKDGKDDDPPTRLIATMAESDPTAMLETALHIRDESVTPTPFPTASRELRDPSWRTITAETARAFESAPPPEPGSNPDPTTSTKLDPGFVHLVPGTLVDAYEVEKLLGAGGMGAVYGAHHEKLGRRAAIKVIAPRLSRDRGAIERFEQEAQALARLSHPNIVAVLAVGTLPGDGRSFFIMEWLDGESLQARLDRGRTSLGDALDLMDQIARGLQGAHAAGIVHRDLKPDNCWLQRVGGEARPVVKLLDFGLSKLTQHRRSEETVANVMFGTPQFMSPEQCQSARDVGPATDTYALGCIAYQLLCGRLPFLYDNVAELIVAHQTEEPPRPRDLDPAIDHDLDALIYAMLAKDPARRPTLSAARSRIARARKRVTSSKPGAPSQQATAQRAVTAPIFPSRRLRRALLGAGVALVGLVVVAAALGTRGQAEDRGASDREHAAQMDADTAGNVVLPLDAASAPAAILTPSIDAAATPRETAKPIAPHAKEEVATSEHERVPTPADARAADDPADAMSATVEVIDARHPEIEIDKAQPEVVSRTPSTPETKPPRPQVHHPGSSRSTAPKPLNKSPTYNPFTRKPSSR